MAGTKFGVDQTNLQGSNFKAYVNPGVVDRSGAVAAEAMVGNIGQLGNLAKMGFDLHKNIKEGEINTATQKTIADYMDSKKAVGYELADIEMLKEYETSLWDDPTVTKEDMGTVEKALQGKYSSLKSALDQGVMTPEEFSIRVTSNLREATNKNPALYRELSAEATRVLELSGILGIVESDKLIAKSKATAKDDAWKDMTTRMKEVNMSYNSVQEQNNMPELSLQLAQYEAATRTHTAITRGAEYFKMDAASQGRAFVQSIGPLAVGGIIETEKQLTSILSDSTPGTYAQKILGARQLIEQQKLLYEQGTPSGVRMEPNVIAGKESYFKSLDTMIANLDSFANGKDALLAIQNQANTQKYIQESNLRKEFDLEKIDLLNRFVTAWPGVVIKERGGIETAGLIFRAITGPLGEGKLVLGNILPKTLSDPLLDTVVKAAAVADKEGYSTLVKTLHNMNNTIQTSEVSVDQRNLSLFKMVNSLAEIDASKKPMTTSESKVVEETIGLLLMDKDEGFALMATLMKQGNTEMDVLPDGRAVFSGDNASQFTNKFGNKINTSLKAFANAHGMSTKEAAPLFYKTYLSPFVTNE